jgi:hypothetical protein
MRQAIIDLCQELSIVLILVDTNGKISEFVSSEKSITASEGPAAQGENDKKVYSSFYKFLYIDQFVPKQYEASLNEQKTLYNTILNRNPRENLFLYGRPLWHNNFNPLELAQNKLICAASWQAGAVLRNGIDYSHHLLFSQCVQLSRSTLTSSTIKSSCLDT